MKNRFLIHAALAAALVPSGVATAAPTGGPATSGTAFNPSLSVIIDGLYYRDGRHADDDADEGDGHDHGHDELDQGFSLRELELVLSAAVDPYWDAMVALAVGGEGIEVEEAFVTSRALPHGLQLKAGRFLSDIGYVNNRHPHSWAFVDRPSVNAALFGEHGLQDDGVQFAWVPPTPFYSRFGVEALQGDPDHGAGPDIVTAFAKFAPELGYDHALQLGLFAGDEDGDDGFMGVDGVYKYTPGGERGRGTLVLQGEYADRGADDGFYLQALYGLGPRWNAGLRAERVSGDEPERSLAAQLAWMPTEYSRLRLQVARAEDRVAGVAERYNQLYLQWQMSVGAHGAHAF